MKKLLTAALTALACIWLAAPAQAQQAIGYLDTISNKVVVKPVTPSQGLPIECLSGCAAPAAFSPSGAASLSTSTTSARVALPSGANVLLVNNGSADLYYKLGSSTVAATTADFPLPAGRAIVVSAGSNGYVAAITGSGSTTLAVTTGSGSPVISGGGGGGGSGGGDASAANQTAVQADAGFDATKAVAVQGITGGAPLDINCATGCGAVTMADGASVALGSKADAACASAASSCSTNSILKGLLSASLDTSPIGVGGDVAADAADSGSPVKTGGLAKTADPTAVADGDRVNALYDVLGKQVTIPALRAQKGVQQTTITSSTAETTIVTAGAAGVFRDLYGLVISNTSASDGSCTIKDATGGTTRAVIAVGAGKTGGFTVEAGSAIPQAAAANNWTATCTSLASWNITAMFVATKG